MSTKVEKPQVYDSTTARELLGKELEETRHLVSDFHHFLSGIQNQMPDTVLQMVSPQIPSFLTDSDKQTIDHVQREIDKIKIELQGINHERVVVDVLTRPSLSEIKQLVTQSLVKEHLATRAAEAKQVQARRQQQGPLHQHHQQHYNHHKQGTSHGQDNSNNENGETKYDPLANLDEPIRIPDYIPPHLRGKRPMSPKKAMHPIGQRPVSNVPNYPLKPVSARSVGDVTVVPNIKVGELPPDLRNLKIQPTMPAGASGTKTKKKKRATAPSSSSSGAAMNFSPLAKNFQLRFNEAEAEMKRLREQLAKADTRFNRERLRSNKKLQAIADMIEEKQLWKDHALLSSIDQLIQEAINGFHDVVDEVDLIEMLEEVIQEIPKPQDYCFVTPTTYVPPPDFTLPKPEHIPQPQPQMQPTQEYQVINVVRRAASPPPPPPQPISVTTEVQTEPEQDDISIQVSLIEPEVKPEHAPQPSPPPTPQIIQPQFVFQKDGVESELVKLMQTMILNYQTTVQGQQAVMMEMLQDRGFLKREEEVPTEEVEEEHVVEEQKIEEVVLPPPVMKEDKELQTDLEEPQQVIETIVSPPSMVEEDVKIEDEVSSKPAYKYKTAFGEVVLGGKGMTGPYAVEPRISYYAHEYASSSTPTTAPGLRRRVAGLTMKLMQEQQTKPMLAAHATARANRSQWPVAGEIDELDLGPQNNLPSNVMVDAAGSPAVVSQANILEFASKLIDAVSAGNSTKQQSQHQHPLVSKEDINSAINDGIAKGIQQALGLLGHLPGNGPSYPPASTVTDMEKKLTGRKSHHLDDDAFAYADARDGPLLTKGDVKTKDSLDSDVIYEEIEKSKKIRQEMLREDAEGPEGYRHNHDLEDALSYNDTISLDSEYQALYGSFDPFHHPPVHHIEESIPSSENDEISDDEEIDVKRHWPRTVGGLEALHGNRDPIHDDLSLTENDEVSVSISTSLASDDSRAMPLSSSMLPPLCSQVLPQAATTKIKEKVMKMKAKQQDALNAEKQGGGHRGFYDHLMDEDRRASNHRNTFLHRGPTSTIGSSLPNPSYGEDSSMMSSSSASSVISSSTASSMSSSRFRRRSTEDRERRKEILSSLNNSSKSSFLAKNAFNYSDGGSASPSSSTSSYRSYKDNNNSDSRKESGKAGGRYRGSNMDESFDYSSASDSGNSFRNMNVPLLHIRGFH